MEKVCQQETPEKPIAKTATNSRRKTHTESQSTAGSAAEGARPAEICGAKWLPSSDLVCTLPPHKTGMHWAKYWDPVTEGGGEMWWNGENLEVRGQA